MFNTPHKPAIDAHNAGLTNLEGLLALVNNPAPYLELHALARKETALTQEQADKYAEAIAFMAKYDIAKAALDTRTAEVEKSETALAEDVSAHNASMNRALDALGKQKDAQDITERAQAAAQKKIDEAWVEMQTKYDEALKPHTEFAQVNEKDRKANEKEKARLEKLAAKLEKKAARFKELSSEDEDE